MAHVQMLCYLLTYLLCARMLCGFMLKMLQNYIHYKANSIMKLSRPCFSSPFTSNFQGYKILPVTLFCSPKSKPSLTPYYLIFSISQCPYLLSVMILSFLKFWLPVFWWWKQINFLSIQIIHWKSFTVYVMMMMMMMMMMMIFEDIWKTVGWVNFKKFGSVKRTPINVRAGLVECRLASAFVCTRNECMMTFHLILFRKWGDCLSRNFACT